MKGLYKEKNIQAKAGDAEAQKWIAKHKASVARWRSANLEKYKAAQERYVRAKGVRPIEQYHAFLFANRKTKAELSKAKTEWNRNNEAKLRAEAVAGNLHAVVKITKIREGKKKRVAATRARKPISDYKQMQALAKEGDPKAIEYIAKCRERCRQYKLQRKAQRLAAA